MTGVSKDILNRKGARKTADIPDEVLTLLNTGKIETANLTEWLAVDQLRLLEVFLKEVGQEVQLSTFAEAINQQKKPTANSNTKTIGLTFGLLFKQKEVFDSLRKHTSDVVRCWGCWAESIQVDTLPELLQIMRPYAEDSHFGLREVVIFATKDRLAGDLLAAIDLLIPWTSSNDENARRYAIEALRPIGVWTKKIAELQQNPKVGLPILEPLKSDASKYVQNAVANWLNDASKSNPDWVQSICNRWQTESATKETTYIVKRALRTINK